MTTKKTEAMELENTALEEAVVASQENTEQEIPADPDIAPQEKTEDMDLNELLGSMDADPEDETLPVAEEEEAFTAELLAELGEDADGILLANHENVSEPSKGQESPVQEEMDQMEVVPEKPKRAARRKKTEAAAAPEGIQKNTPEEASEIVFPDSQ